MGKVIKPPSMLGMLGGGQLGKFFVIAAHRLGYRVTVLDPDQESPAGKIADNHICSSFSDKSSLDLMINNCEAISTEFENIPSETIKYLEQKVIMHPNSLAISIVQSRVKEKQFIKDLKLPIGPYEPIVSIESFSHLKNKKLFPAIFKQSQFGYDGKGQSHVNNIDEAKIVFNSSNETEFVLEKKLSLDKEISVVLSRSSNGVSKIFPVIENHHEAGILDLSIVPARVNENLKKEAVDYALELAKNLNYIGTIAVEFFISDKKLYVNEIAPRPHNSGHFTLDACNISQFDQQVLSLVGENLIDIRLENNAVMLNLLGDLWLKDGGVKTPKFEEIEESEVNIHLYGKNAPRIGRKMGHITIIGKNIEDLISKAGKIRSKLWES
ncbi:MAG: 5-(carboxyamino)imidazole ribonucleotide synthase [Nitrosomonadales bacterium]|jgi:5-(carboxyamino)imidazole ribonucleotide synthase|nr:5-(carboxyamino)imidazole ribonucleotide synthase [Nitrosomonadales bacterium]MBT4759237.1 5-(carboxyamino)imidazole ribonucleotide synthase [Nitrosomonadales bacterium]MBT6015031.1 5-(carboxyamino)imidazole ribonucleotide synthase [Nitrosomonadales bacterium]MBT6603334.1 5-(carboxyamino)imidazole ribonucleotide synthase [Nitrosomonadales bacterium]MBT7407909.1 5-(carboxyamino)imidazole ribonucleotide synthase [Nitrosomonadales bacterium]